MFRRRIVRRMRHVMRFALLALLLNLTYPTPTHASNTHNEIPTPSQPIVTTVESTIELPPPLPIIADKPQPAIARSLTIRSSAYSSTVDQTDGDPFTTASGTKVHQGTVATNCLPFGTKIRIPEYFGDAIFTVEDRMHSRWGCGKMDIWMTSRAEALQWGVRTINIEILQS